MTIDLRMAWRSLQRTRGLTAVMILALALGIGTWYAQRQIFTFLTGKMPAAPAGLYHVALERGEARTSERPRDVVPLFASIFLTPRDASAVAAAAPGRHAVTFGAPALLEVAGRPSEVVRARYATRELFELFAIPLRAGRAWEAPGETVLDESVASRWFGAASIGQTIRVDGSDMRVVGVVAASHHDRYHLYERFVPVRDGIYLPLSHAAAVGAEPEVKHVVAGGETGLASAWVELPTPEARAAFVTAVEQHLAGERAAGRAGTPRAVTLRSADELRRFFAPGGTIGLWPMLSALCVITCLVNLVRMLMVKFAGRRHELGLLRAFGARRRGVMGQLLVEATLIGLVAGVIGVLVGMALMPIAQGTVRGTVGSPELLGVEAALTTVAAAIGCALVAALYPAWRLVRGAPVHQLRSSR